MQRYRGLHSILRYAVVYNLSQRLAGAVRARRIFAEEHVQAHAGVRILDIGCGTAEILPYLGDVDYTGFDPNPRYIASAKRRHPRHTFICSRATNRTLEAHAPFDIIIAMFLVHHLSDRESTDLYRLARSKLEPGGKAVVIDPCFTPEQSAATRWLLAQDRGRHVRDVAAYRRLAQEVFPMVSTVVRHDLLWMPYSHCITTLRGRGEPG